MANVYTNCGCGCNNGGGGSPAVRVVAGNDLTVEALLSVYDKDSGVYKSLDLSNASDVSLRLVGTFSKVEGKYTAVTGSKVSALFPADSLKVGAYGVEITFTDSDGKGRAFERNLIGVVATSGEATVESSVEGDTGEGLNITVDVKTRTVRIGGSGSGVTDYSLLENRPKINGVTLDGDKTSEDLGLMPEDGAYSKEEVDERLENLPESYTKEEADGRFETKERASGTYQTKEKAAADMEAVTTALDGKVAKESGKGLSTNDFTDEDKKRLDSALQEYTETDPTVPDWAKKPTKPTYTPEEVGALPATTKIPSKVSDLENDKGFQTESDLAAALAGKVDSEEGKGLSSNDYTNADKAKMGALPRVHSISDICTIVNRGGSILTKDQFDGVYDAARFGLAIWGDGMFWKAAIDAMGMDGNKDITLISMPNSIYVETSEIVNAYLTVLTLTSSDDNYTVAKTSVVLASKYEIPSLTGYAKTTEVQEMINAAVTTAINTEV